MKFVGLVNSAWHPLVLLKCALYTEEKSTTAAKKKEKKKRKTQNMNAQNVNPNRTTVCVLINSDISFDAMVFSI